MPSWYVYTTDAAWVRLLTDDGAPSPELSTESAVTLAEHELRHLELAIALQR